MWPLAATGGEERGGFGSDISLTSLLTCFAALDTSLNASFWTSHSSIAKWEGRYLLYEVDVKIIDKCVKSWHVIEAGKLIAHNPPPWFAIQPLLTYLEKHEKEEHMSSMEAWDRLGVYFMLKGEPWGLVSLPPSFLQITSLLSFTPYTNLEQSLKVAATIPTHPSLLLKETCQHLVLRNSFGDIFCHKQWSPKEHLSLIHI
jgi:hypothetical protein